MLSRVRLFATPWTVAYQAPPSMGFSRQEYWSGLLFPSPGNLPDSGIEPTSLMSPALAGRFLTTGATFYLPSNWPIPPITLTSLVAQTVKASAYNVGDLGSIPGSGRSSGEEMATHTSTLAWKIPWTEEHGRLQSMGLERVRHD